MTHCATCGCDRAVAPAAPDPTLCTVGHHSPGCPHEPIGFEPDHFRSIWFENVRVFENDEGTGWRCVDDEGGRIGEGSTPHAAIAAMFGGAATPAAPEALPSRRLRDAANRVLSDYESACIKAADQHGIDALAALRAALGDSHE